METRIRINKRQIKAVLQYAKANDLNLADAANGLIEKGLIYKHTKPHGYNKTPFFYSPI